MYFEDREIIVQNDDTSIIYAGEWTTVQASVVDYFGNFGPAFSLTLHSTTATGSFSFAFNGSAVDVIGTVSITNASAANPDPDWQCVLDGMSFSPNIFQYPENNWQLCSQTNIPDGAHELIINVTSEGIPFYLDYIRYRPSPSVPLEETLIYINNFDPAIDYISGWGPLGGTANQTTDPSSLVNVTFVGTQLFWYGFVPTEESHNASSGEYSVDGQPFVSFQLEGLPLASSGSYPTIYNQLFFTTPKLQMGTHVLSAKYTGESGQTPFTLNYLIVANGSFPSSSSFSPEESGSGIGTSTTQSATQLPTGSNISSSHSEVIIGSVVGGVGGFLILCSVIFVWLRYRKRMKQDRTHDDDVLPNRHSSLSIIESFKSFTQSQKSNPESISLAASRFSESYGTSTTSDSTHLSRTLQSTSSRSSLEFSASSYPGLSATNPHRSNADTLSSETGRSFPTKFSSFTRISRLYR